jgi:hypothetical protein
MKIWRNMLLSLPGHGGHIPTSAAENVHHEYLLSFLDRHLLGS